LLVVVVEEEEEEEEEEEFPFPSSVLLPFALDDRGRFLLASTTSSSITIVAEDFDFEEEDNVAINGKGVG
jgi:hypothetical protein